MTKPPIVRLDADAILEFMVGVKPFSKLLSGLSSMTSSTFVASIDRLNRLRARKMNLLGKYNVAPYAQSVAQKLIACDPCVVLRPGPLLHNCSRGICPFCYARKTVVPYAAFLREAYATGSKKTLTCVRTSSSIPAHQLYKVFPYGQPVVARDLLQFISDVRPPGFPVRSSLAPEGTLRYVVKWFCYPDLLTDNAVIEWCCASVKTSTSNNTSGALDRAAFDRKFAKAFYFPAGQLTGDFKRQAHILRTLQGSRTAAKYGAGKE